MELLKFSEGLDHILLLGESLRLLAKLLLSLKVLAEVKVAKLTIDLHHIIELLDIELICLSDVSVILCRNRSDRSPACLDLAEFRECGIDILLLFEERLEICDHSLFKRKVFLPLLLKRLVVLRALFLIPVILLFKACLYDCERVICRNFRNLFRCLFFSRSLCAHDTRLRLFLLKPLIESGLYRLGLLGHLHPFLILHELLKKGDKLCQSLF